MYLYILCIALKLHIKLDKLQKSKHIGVQNSTKLIFFKLRSNKYFSFSHFNQFNQNFSINYLYLLLA